MVPTRDWAHHLSALRSRAARLRGHSDTTDATRRLIDEALGSCADLLDAFSRSQAESERLLDEMRGAILAHRRLFECLPCACITTDQHGTILHANDAAGRLLNITSKRLEGRELLLYSHNRDAFMTLLAKLPLSDTPISVPIIVRPRERRPLQTALTVTPLDDIQTGVWMWFLVPMPFAVIPEAVMLEAQPAESKAAAP